MANRSAIGRRNRARGKKWELICRKLLYPIFGEKDVVSRRDQEAAGRGGPDIGMPTWSPECKDGKNRGIHKAMPQCLEAAKVSGKVPVVLTRDTARPRKVWRLAIFDSVTWLKLVKQIQRVDFPIYLACVTGKNVYMYDEMLKLIASTETTRAVPVLSIVYEGREDQPSGEIFIMTLDQWLRLVFLFHQAGITEREILGEDQDQG